jgi:alpha-tubulin suppressor-like RCC1 family protein
LTTLQTTLRFILLIDQYNRLFTIDRYADNWRFSQVSGITNCKLAAGWTDYDFNGARNRIYAVNNSGELYAAGNNPYGLLGSGITNSGSANIPNVVLVKTLGSPNNIISLAPVTGGLLSLTSSGEIWCIGYNDDGVFGRGNTNINSANTSFVKSSGTLFYDKISSSTSSSVITLGY